MGINWIPDRGEEEKLTLLTTKVAKKSENDLVHWKDTDTPLSGLRKDQPVS